MYTNNNRANQSARGKPQGSASRGRGQRQLNRDNFGARDTDFQPQQQSLKDFGDFNVQGYESNKMKFDSRRDTRTSDFKPAFNGQNSGSTQSRATFQSRVISDYRTPADGEFTSFPEMSLTTRNQLSDHNIGSLFPIQQECFYPIYHGANVIGRELTGCGKTLAFALPIVEQLRQAGNLGSGKTQAIVLAPTRELALQVEKTFDMLKHQPNEFQTLTVYGGVSLEDQKYKLQRGVDIFVGTTGRVLDHIRRGNIKFGHIKTVILDEADMMLDMGFKEDIDEILLQVSNAMQKSQSELQICLFSATVPDWVRKVANEYMKGDFIMVDLAKDLANKTARNVKHLAIHVEGQHEQLKALNAVLTAATGGSDFLPKAIVFTQTKVEANTLFNAGGGMKGGIGVMHGDVTQASRERQLGEFKKNKLRVLVATDVAARGLDIPNVDLVVQYHPPKNAETYIHRSGRTARAGASGTCVTFYDQSQIYMIRQIQDQAGIKMERVTDLSKISMMITPNQVESTQRDHERKPPSRSAAAMPPQRQTQRQQQPPARQHKDVSQRQAAPKESSNHNLQDFEANAENMINLNDGNQKKVICQLIHFIVSKGHSLKDVMAHHTDFNGTQSHQSTSMPQRQNQRVERESSYRHSQEHESSDKENQSPQKSPSKRQKTESSKAEASSSLTQAINGGQKDEESQADPEQDDFNNQEESLAKQPAQSKKQVQADSICESVDETDAKMFEEMEPYQGDVVVSSDNVSVDEKQEYDDLLQVE